jgi:hypothetical protein
MVQILLWVLGNIIVPAPFLPAPGREFTGYFGRHFAKLPGLKHMQARGWPIWLVWWNMLILGLYFVSLDLLYAYLIDFGRRCDDHFNSHHKEKELDEPEDLLA